MINKIKITNLRNAESYSFNKNDKSYDLWISVVGAEDRKNVNRMRTNFKEKQVTFFSQFFADWSDEDGIVWSHLKAEAPQLQHIQSIITFLKPYAENDKPHCLGVNCFAGISRSTAVGIIALVLSGRSVENALTEILKVRPEAWPNIRILDIGSKILGIDIKTHVVEWKDRCLNSRDIFMPPDREQPEAL
jgi:predicted protein tyrosine phosphatase